MKVTYWVQTDKIGSKCEDELDIDEEEWNEMSEEERSVMIFPLICEMIDWSFATEKEIKNG